MKLLVGIGNPGKMYNNTRHNIGISFVEQLAKTRLITWKNKYKLKSSLAYTNDYILCKPNVFMNLSGVSVLLVKNYYQIPLENIMIIHDDIDLSFLKVKLKLGGGSGGHNGLKSIDNCLANNKYFRLRLGIGRPKYSLVSQYVLTEFPDDQRTQIEQKFSMIEKFFDLFIDNKTELFQNKLSILNA